MISLKNKTTTNKYNHSNKLFITGILLILVFLGCDKITVNKEILPKSIGRDGEILVVMDSLQWHGDIGKTIQSILEVSEHRFPQVESLYDLIYLKPSDFNRFLKKHKNIIIAFSLDHTKSREVKILKNQFTDKSIKNIRSNSSIYKITKKGCICKRPRYTLFV